MASEVPQRVRSAPEELPLDSQRGHGPLKVDPFSLLPPELLDYIYELAADAYELATDGLRFKMSTSPPSKLLHAPHERALHKLVAISDNDKLELFSKTLDTHPRLPVLVKRLWFACSPSPALMFHVFSKLPALTILEPPPGWPQLLEMVESGDNPGRYLANLKTCRLLETEVTSGLVKGLSLLPNLRRVEFNQSSLNVDSPFITANQVEEVVVRIPRSSTLEGMAADPSSFLRFFPSAKIISVHFWIKTRSECDWLRKILPPLAPILRSLHLSYDDDPIPKLPPVDYSDFSSLRKLFVETPSLLDPSNLLENPFPLPHLVDLYLVFRDLHPDILKLFQGPQRLRHLQYLALEYHPCVEGSIVDIRMAEAEMEAGEWDEAGKGWALVEDCLSMEDMSRDMDDWLLPFIDYSTRGGFYEQEVGGFKNGLRVAAEMEELAKKAGVVVFSDPGLDGMRETFWLQVLEYHRRGVVRAFLGGDFSVLKDARRLANLYGVPLPPLLIDLDANLSKDKLRYFKVDMSQAFISTSQREWSTFNLRYREEGEVDF